MVCTFSFHLVLNFYILQIVILFLCLITFCFSETSAFIPNKFFLIVFSFIFWFWPFFVFLLRFEFSLFWRVLFFFFFPHFTNSHPFPRWNFSFYFCVALHFIVFGYMYVICIIASLIFFITGTVIANIDIRWFMEHTFVIVYISSNYSCICQYVIWV